MMQGHNTNIKTTFDAAKTEARKKSNKETMLILQTDDISIILLRKTQYKVLKYALICVRD